jgi:uncharacterized protein YndB with AHSA1/START domain
MPPLSVTVHFIDLGGGKSKVRSHCEAISEEERQKMMEIGMEQGYMETLDRLEDYLAAQAAPEMKSGEMTLPAAKSKFDLPSPRQITMSRVLNAPRELVFAAHVDPKLFVQWWGLRDDSTHIDQWDMRPGGLWRVVQRDREGNENAFRGEYREIVPPERLVMTFEWEGLPGHIVVDDMRLEALAGGKTRLTTTSTFASQEDRDGMLASGMESGANESWDQLEELLARQVA